MQLSISNRLLALCRETEGGTVWLNTLPETVERLMDEWSLQFDLPLTGEEASCSYVAPVRCHDGSPAVLKVGIPHMEAEDEILGLRFWNGDATVRLLAADRDSGAMLLERCSPGTSLRALPECEQDAVIATLLRRLWRQPAEPHGFRPLSTMVEYWSRETLAQERYWPDAGLVRQGLQLFRELPKSAIAEVLLATDLHAGNVLEAERQPWLVIDPKPFVGDPAYDATQHLLNCPARLRSERLKLIQTFSSLLGVEAQRVRLWTFARLAAEPRGVWDDFDRFELAAAIGC